MTESRVEKAVCRRQKAEEQLFRAAFCLLSSAYCFFIGDLNLPLLIDSTRVLAWLRAINACIVAGDFIQSSQQPLWFGNLRKLQSPTKRLELLGQIEWLVMLCVV